MAAIDINADLGETVDGVPTADDEAMFALISSSSIACGGHAGDAASMRAAVARAARHGVAIGAHPSFDDREHFGRRELAVDPLILRQATAVQLAALEAAGADIRYVKPHGALYHVVQRDARAASALAAAVADFADRAGRAVPVLCQHGEIEHASRAAGLPFATEAFLDRGYRADGTLVARGEPGALLDDPAAVAARAVRLARDRIVESVDGAAVAVDAQSLCVHGDTAAAVVMARAVRDALTAAGVRIRAPW